MPEAIRDHAAETVLALAVFAASLVLAQLLPSVLGRSISLVSRSREPERDRRLSAALKLPAQLLVVAAGVLIAVRVLSYSEGYRTTVDRIGGAVTLALVVLAAQRLLSALLFPSKGSAGASAAPLGHVAPLARRALNMAILVVGALLVLDQLGISISPLLAGLGITGLAVALALQPLLTNLFAGSYVISDSSIRERDYIEMLNGPSGYVTDIGWRATRLRGPAGEVVIVPNATLAASIVTNHGPGRSTLVSVTYPIPYGHPLERVQEVADEELRSIVLECEGAAKERPPRLWFRRFTDARIECTAELVARSRSDAPELTHVLAKRIHDRFQLEGFNEPPRGG